MRKTVSVSKELAGLIRRVADMRQISQADAIREAIKDYMGARGYA